jgi:hypothetical protein
MAEPSPGAGEILARLSHLWPLLPGRRVLVLGSPEAGAASAAFLAERAVPVIRTAPDESGLEGASFDLAVLHDVPAPEMTPGRARALRALLPPGGLLAVAAAPGDREAVAAALGEAFPVVEVAALSRLSAWAVAPAAARPGEVTWDGSLLGGVRATSYLLLCGAARSGLRGATVLALPGSAGDPAAHPREAEATAELRALLERADDALAAAYCELAGASDRIAAESRRAAEARSRASAAEEQAFLERSAVERGAARQAELESELVTLLWRKDEADQALATASAERDALAAQRRRPGAEPPDRAGDEADLPDLLPP